MLSTKEVKAAAIKVDCAMLTMTREPHSATAPTTARADCIALPPSSRIACLLNVLCAPSVATCLGSAETPLPLDTASCVNAGAAFRE